MAIDQALFRQVLSNFASGVTVVTTTGRDERPHGLTATAFTSVSLVPPLVLVCVDKQAETYPEFESAGVFAVNFLALDQQNLSKQFAVSGGDKFSGVRWRFGVLRTPILDDTIAHMECRIVHAYDGGDHTIYVGEIESGATSEREPLTYFRHFYRRLEAAS